MSKLCILLGVIIYTCHAEQITINPSVTGGLPVEIEDFPYAASIQLSLTRGPTHFSTGTILNSRWILTTESRLKFINTPNIIKVRTGSTHSENSGTVYSVDEKISHPSYDPNVYNFDLALLKVDRDIEFNDNTQTIGLYTNDASIDANLTGSLIGWGNTYLNKLKVSRLYSVELKTTGITDGLNLYISVTDDKVCYADVGGPFVVNGLVLGISTLNRIGCGGTDQYVTRFDDSTLEWINRVIMSSK